MKRTPDPILDAAFVVGTRAKEQHLLTTNSLLPLILERRIDATQLSADSIVFYTGTPDTICKEQP